MEQTGEQAAAMQKENCIFCHIIEGKIPSKKVYEDDQVIGILDINPANAGHVLLMPREHFIFMPQVPSQILSRIFTTAKMLSQATLKTVKSEGTTILVANGGLAGQRAPHFMVHIIPRLTGDGLTLAVGEGQVAPEVAAKVKVQLKETLSSLFGLKTPAIEQATLTKPTPEKKQSAPKKEEADLDSITSMLTGGKND